MTNWKETTLGEVAAFSNGRTSPERFESGKYEVFGSNGVIGLSDEINSDANTIIIGRVGSYCGSLYFSKSKCWVTDNAIKANAKETSDPFYLYYLLITQKLNSKAAGSGQPLINQEILNSIEVEIPPLPEQKAIAAILSSLDDKIELLRRQNKTLELIARTIFRYRFVDKAQEDWQLVKIGDFVKTNALSINHSFKSKKIQYLDTSSITEGEVHSIQLLKISDSPSRAKRIVRHNDIVYSTVRPDQKHYGILKYPAENMIASTGFCVLTCTKINPHFIYILLTSDEMIAHLHLIAEGTTSTYPSLKPTDIENIKFRLPPEDKMLTFSKYADSAWEKIYNNHSQIQTLSKLRDALLPKLMKGEIRIENPKLKSKN